MSEIKAILVDDESSARNILRNLLTHFCPIVKIVGETDNLPEAVELIKKDKPHVVFLDIEMPGYAGYEIVKFFKTIDFDIVFTTAYSDYALKAFEISATDYLVKPIEIDRLKKAVEKINQRLALKLTREQLEMIRSSIQGEELKQIAVMDKGYREFISIDQIIAIEAQRAYCNIHTKDGDLHCVAKNLKHFENVLSEQSNFFRAHKSWLINLGCIKSYSKARHEIKLAGGITAKLSKYRIAEFESSASEVLGV